jgi:hypothetical protein
MCQEGNENGKMQTRFNAAEILFGNSKVIGAKVEYFNGWQMERSK